MVAETFDLEYVIKVLPKLLAALPTTLYITAMSVLFGWLLGLAFTFVRVSRHKAVSRISGIISSIIRGIPTVVILYLVYFGLPLLVRGTLGIEIGTWQKTTFVIIAIALETTVSSSEMFRSAYNSLDKGQLEAAHALGMKKRQQFFRIILPQGLYVILPNLTSSTLALIQATSLVYTLGVMDVLGKARQLNSNNEFGLKSLESYIAVALIYWAFSFIVLRLFKLLERWIGRGMRTVASSADN